MGGITTIVVTQSLLSPLNLEVDPNIQAMRTQEKEQMETLKNKFASFVVMNKMVETKWSLQQQRKMAGNNMDSMLESYIHNLRQQLETLGQEKLTLEVELGNMQGLMEDFKNRYEDEINTLTKMENEFALTKKDVNEAYMNKVELMQLCEETRELQSQISDTSVVLSRDNSHSLDMDSIIAEVKAQYKEIANHSRAVAESLYQIKRSCRGWLGSTGMTCHTKTEISEMNWNVSQLRLRLRTSKARGLPWRPPSQMLSSTWGAGC
ncbi:LOW QUALITY PROTEIN: Keratin, type II cytoskeletal 8 [Plecturocebus cupreus]